MPTGKSSKKQKKSPKENSLLINLLNMDFSSVLIGRRYRILRLFLWKERQFLQTIIIFFIIAGIFYPYPTVAMWLGFAFAGYSAIANDSIQTIGTFLASNFDKKWWVLWIYIGGIFLITMTVGWIIYDGDVSFQRLQSKGFDKAPESFNFLQVASPLVLLILTRLRMPVSTTFLLLSTFSATSTGIIGVAQKSLFGYLIAFVVSILVWLIFAKGINNLNKGKAHGVWTAIQWITSGLLWAVWLMQDAANIAVFLPRKLSVGEFLAFSLYIFLGLGLLLYFRGGKIQNIINEKSAVKDVRGATVIDFVYSMILIFFQNLSKVPMSTTWVFLGLLAGREIAMNLSPKYTTVKKRKLGFVFRLVGRDALFALIGLVISVLMAIAVNRSIQEEIISLFR
ncbi:hypothetical protein [Schleiferia thermophila]|uniref:Phosphate/sulfate permease n=1 Tax=Schleiferia thermophila TaxID=884107 RepID=A0A369ABL1_9FLAO|nr:hypothetical protein [Schleiferia thermophila]RCX04814.1 hypothetical protein DES35_10184 [Schleiferia thermophila]GCD79659.1 hypothetical protein JCM30197_09060 [Schleiferia thermophila]